MNKKKTSVALSSVVASLLLTVSKLTVGILTGSMGIISEALHSSLDFGAALLTLFAVRMSDKPADDKHPYGHGKVESVSALIETGLLFITSGWIVYEAVKKIVQHNYHVEATWYAFVIIIVSILVDLSRSKALSKVAAETRSQALEADALHFTSDVYSSILVLIGLILSRIGWNIADPIAAIGVSIFVLRAAWELGKKTVDVLIDSAPEGLADNIVRRVLKVEGVIGVEKIKVRPAGSIAFVELSVTVSRNLTVEKAHSLSSVIQDKVRASFPEVELEVKTIPVKPDNETMTERIHTLAHRYGMSVHHVFIHKKNNSLNINLDLEMSGDMDFLEAHALSTKFEDDIKNDFGQEIEIYAHIEPIKKSIILDKDDSKINMQKEDLVKKINNLSLKISELNGISELNFHSTENGLVVALKCNVRKKLTINQVHFSVRKFEKLILSEIPEIISAVIHPEPI